MKYMLIKRGTDAAKAAYEEMDFIEVSSKEEAAEWAARCPLGPGSKLEVRRVTDESDFAAYADNEYLQKEVEWRAAAEKADKA